MANVLPPTLLELLNSVVNGQLENYEISFEEVKFQGDNFLGKIMYVSLGNKNADNCLELVVKQTTKAVEMSFFQGIYKVEINFYEDIWPVLNRFQQNFSIGFDKVPKYYASKITAGKEMIILENLKSHNFHIFEATKPLDWKHIELIFKSYATFHAMSYAFHELHPEEFSKLKTLTNKRNMSLQDIPEPNTRQNEFLKFTKTNFEYVTKLFNENDDQDMIKKLKQYVETSDKSFFEASLYIGDTPMLLHGDCWSNNMMFKYNVSVLVVFFFYFVCV